MMPANFSNPLAILASGVRMDSRISAADRRAPTCVSAGPIAAPSLPILWHTTQPAPRKIAIGSVLPPAMPWLPPAAGAELDAAAAGWAGVSAGGTATGPPCGWGNAVGAQVWRG